jgi:hypothetical protein
VTQIPSEVYRAGYLDAARAPLQPSADEIKAYAEGMRLPCTCIKPRALRWVSTDHEL